MPESTPYRQIRAHYDDETITVYQAYSAAIGDAAVAAQKLDASPDFKVGSRMTWIKPSWSWMMYRAGYSFKDARQARILAIKMKHEDLQNLLRHARVENSKSQPQSSDKESRDACVVVQWDPERTPSTEKLPYRSIQIGIPGKLSKTWVDEWIVGIEDVTEKAKKLKKAIDVGEYVGVKSLVGRGLVPEERAYDVPTDLQRILCMNEGPPEEPDFCNRSFV